MFPGHPFMFEEFRSLTDKLPELEPTVPCWAAGPFLLPGAPAIPAPEFCELGAAPAPVAEVARSGWPGG